MSWDRSCYPFPTQMAKESYKLIQLTAMRIDWSFGQEACPFSKASNFGQKCLLL